LTPDAEFARSGKGHWSERKLSVVPEPLLGADLESLRRKYGVHVTAVLQRREAFPAAGDTGLKTAEEDLVDEQVLRMKPVIAGLARKNQLLRERVGRTEDGKAFLWWSAMYAPASAGP
jgi:hypothetical protein